MSARQEKVREALAYLADAAEGSLRKEKLDAALAEVEEWEAWVERLRSSVHEAHTVRAEAAEAALKDVAKAWFDFDQEALDTLLGPYREEEA